MRRVANSKLRIGENHRLRQRAEFGLKLPGLELDIEETALV